MEAQVFYRYWWHRTRFYEEVDYSGSSAPVPQYNTNANNHVLGLKLLMGISFASAGNRRIGWINNLYFGVGGRIRWINEEGETRQAYHYSNIFSPYRPFSDHRHEFLPSLHLGWSIGMLVRRKKSAEQE